MTWGNILFPFDPALRDAFDLSDAQVARTSTASAEVEERYSCDSEGGVVVRITNLTHGYHREYRLGRWNTPGGRVVPGRSPRRRHRRRL
jgi:hypothetical protein